MSSRTPFKKLVSVAEKQGWQVQRTRKNHWRFVPPAGRIVITGGSPSDYRQLKNLQSDLRREGLVLQ